MRLPARLIARRLPCPEGTNRDARMALAYIARLAIAGERTELRAIAAAADSQAGPEDPHGLSAAARRVRDAAAPGS